jgi:hypothetical protein
MNTQTLATKLGGAAVVGTALGLTVGIGFAAAAPSQTDGAMLYICQDIGTPSMYRISVKGTYPMDSADATGYLIHMNEGAQPGGLIVELKADDEGNNDRLIGDGFYPTTATTSEGYLRSVPGGLEYRREMAVPRPNFNEDYAQPGSDDDTDEVYAVVTFRDGDGGLRPAVTQSITRNFEVSGICDSCCR